MNPNRARWLNDVPDKQGPVVYWMSRDQRVHCNWALIHAQQQALERQSGLVVQFCLVDRFLGACRGQFDFMIEGLKELAGTLSEKQIPFRLLIGDPVRDIPEFIKKIDAGLLVCDFDPLHIKQAWKEGVAESLTIPVVEVDAHNIVPCWIASRKKEYAAYTFRPRILRQLEEYLEVFPDIVKHPHALNDCGPAAPAWQRIDSYLAVSNRASLASRLQSGEKAARKACRQFISSDLKRYHTDQNDPNKAGQSGLSPYLHFGQVSAQEVALMVEKQETDLEARAAFLEQLIVRRELSDNFCFYERNYDSTEAFPDWSRKTLNDHRTDPREFLYNPEQFENAATHDDLWNAAQMEVVKTGTMQGYMRMYWAKKILEWSGSPEEAMAIAIQLNDRYQLDGRDPNGYTGIAWSIGGVHDRAWSERPVFGKVRFMSYRGCRSKFDVPKYITRIDAL